MRLIQLCQAGELLPPSLPASIIPLSKRTGVGVGVGVGTGVTGVGVGVTGVGGMMSLGTGIHPSPSPSPVPPTSSSSSPTLTRKQVCNHITLTKPLTRDVHVLVYLLC